MYLAHPLVGLETYAPAALARLLNSTNQDVQNLLDAVRRWDKLTRNERQAVLDLIADAVADVRLSLVIGYATDTRRAESPPERRARSGRKPDRRTRRAHRVPYVSAYIEVDDEYPRGTGMPNEILIKGSPFGSELREAALYAAWLLDDAAARKNLEDPAKFKKLKVCLECKQRFYDTSPLKPRKFCSDECKKEYHKRKRKYSKS